MSVPAAKLQPYAGLSYLAQSGSKQHLFVVLNDPVPFPSMGKRDCVCVVNITSMTYSKIDDAACIFNVGSHPFIIHDSFAFYAKAHEEFADVIAANIMAGVWTQKSDFMTNDVLRLKAGFHASANTPRRLKQLPI